MFVSTSIQKQAQIIFLIVTFENSVGMRKISVDIMNIFYHQNNMTENFELGPARGRKASLHSVFSIFLKSFYLSESPGICCKWSG